VKKSCWKWLLPLALLSFLILAGLMGRIFGHRVQTSLKGATSSLLAGQATMKGVTVDRFDGEDAYITGPASLQASATDLVKGLKGVEKVHYLATADPAPPVTAAPATTAAPTTTVAATTTAAPATTAAPTTTAAPATTAAPTTTAAPATTTTAAPATTTTVAAPKKACPALPALTGINFDTSSSDLAGGTQTALDGVVTVLKANAGCKIEVVGHTDNRGSNESNQTLSEARAKSVVDYLVSKGIPAANLTSSGKGETEPVAGSDQNTEAGLAANRRIEFKPSNLGS
jgi:outer membrane protein OmpA-like peptidoglycan-associated protein